MLYSDNHKIKSPNAKKSTVTVAILIRTLEHRTTLWRQTNRIVRRHPER